MARRPFACLVFLALLGMALMMAVALSVLPRPIHHAIERCSENGGCMALVRAGRMWIGPLLVALVPWSLFHGVRSGIGQWHGTHRALSRLGARTDSPPAGPLRDLCDELGLAGKVDVVDTAAPMALCRGYLRPRVVLSTGTIALLPAAELAAVLRHEQAHLRRRHPLQLLIARSLAASLPFIPVLRELARALPQAQELAADRSVIAAGQRSALGRALIVMFSAMGDRPSPAPLALGMSGALDARMDQLVGASCTGVPVSRQALIRSTLFFAVGIALLLLGTPGLSGGPTALTFFPAAMWPAANPWHGLLLPTVLGAALIEGVALTTAARLRGED
ncbi:MAG: M56 family metallopeptidase [Chloroflexota bacterium]